MENLDEVLNPGHVDLHKSDVSGTRILNVGAMNNFSLEDIIPFQNRKWRSVSKENLRT